MRVSSCCCGLSLEKGCKIIAILGMVLGTIGLTAACINWDCDGIIDWNCRLIAIHIINLLSIIGEILGIIAAGMLLWGTLKKKEVPVLAYLIIQALSMITIAVVIVVLAALAAVTSLITATVVAVILAIVTGINVYLWIVVYSFYHQLKPVKIEGSPWKQGICGCFGDFETCLCGCLGCGCLIRRNADDLGRDGLLFYLLSCFCPCAAVFILRQEARERYGIEGSTAGDAACSFCCGQLVACQTGAEIKQRGDHS